MNNNIFINFLPWLTIYQSVKIGKITFWNFASEAEERIKDSQVRERLERHFNSYKNINGSLFPITICVYEGKSFYDNLNDQEFEHLRESITALVFASTIEEIEKRIQTKQKTEVPPSINSFDLMSRRLNLNSNQYEHVSLSMIDLGLQEGSISFQKPLGARGSAYPSRKWIKYLNGYLSIKNAVNLRNRISRSLEFFRIAQAQDDLKDNSPEIAFFTRTVLLATAFESLIFPKGKGQVSVNGKKIRRALKAEYFANYIEEKFKLYSSKKSTRNLENDPNKKPRKERLILAAWWAYDFYKLRNSIVHGDKLTFEKLRFKKGLWFSQMDVGALVFADCLEEIIRSKKIIKLDRNKLNYLIDDIFESRGLENWKKHHKILGWIR